MTIEPISAPRLYERIARSIETEIDGGRFADGDRLPAERVLARQLGVSRSSLREALGALELAGRIEIRVGAGAFVIAGKRSRRRRSRAAAQGMSPFDLLRARRLVEGETAAMAARHASPGAIIMIERAFERLANDMRANRVASRADRDFHQLIADASGNSALAMVVGQLLAAGAFPLNARIETLFVTHGRKRDNIAEHRAVLDAIRNHDASAARRAMRAHLAQAERQRLRILE